MAAPIGPGDFVECVGATAWPEVTVGGIYRVEAIIEAYGDCPACGNEGSEGITFAGHPKRLKGGIMMSWCPCRFRPIYRPRADLIEQLKAPPQRVGEPA